MAMKLTGITGVDTGPVGHHHTVESPLFAKETFKQPLAFGTMQAVDAVVTRHVALGFGFGFGNTERLEVNFSQRSFGNDTVVAESFKFLLVADKVLHGGSDTLRLQAVDIRCGDFATQERVLRKGLEASPAKGGPLNVDRRAEQDVCALCTAFFTELCTDFLGQFDVEGGS